MNSENVIQLLPVATMRASEAIYEQIVQLITTGQLRPGDRLPSERQMMDMLHRSRPTIREALRMLERNGLIQIIPGSSGAVVVEPSTMSVEEPLETMLNMSCLTGQELLEYRELNEVMTAQWAALRRTEEDLAAISQLLHQVPGDPEDFKAFSQQDLAFHQAVAAAGHNRIASLVDKVMHQLVLNILQRAFDRKDPEQKKQMIEEIQASHHLVYDAIAAGDPARASEAMRRHMRMFEKDVVEKE